MDIEEREQTVLEELHMDYFCKYVKQFALEFHAPLRKVELGLNSFYKI
jgi:hypothetical protein